MTDGWEDSSGWRRRDGEQEMKSGRKREGEKDRRRREISGWAVKSYEKSQVPDGLWMSKSNVSTEELEISGEIVSSDVQPKY